MMLDWNDHDRIGRCIYEVHKAHVYIYVGGPESHELISNGSRLADGLFKQRQAQRFYLYLIYISSLSPRSRCSRLRKKHVIFADDEGLSLTEVRVMSEPSNVPPYWSMKFLEQITQGLVSPHPPDKWTVDFKQPASDYLTFR